ncbi:MAG: FAD-dependent oxidoreductase [Minicystis sp.]
MDGFTVEHGSHVFFNYYENIIKIIEELRADPDIGKDMPGFARVPGWTIVDAYGHRATLKQTPGLPEPFSVLPSILSIPWLGLMDRLRIAWGSWNIINNYPYEKYEEADQKSGYELGIENGYSDMGVLAWNSASLGLTNLFMREQSGAVFVGKHKVLINSPDGLSYQLPAGDLSELIPNPLKKKLDKQGVRTILGAEVTRISRAPNEKKTRVVFTRDGAEETLEADHVVSALRPRDAAKLLPWVKAQWTELQPVTPVLTVVLRLSGRVQQSIDDRELGDEPRAVGLQRGHRSLALLARVQRRYVEDRAAVRDRPRRPLPPRPGHARRRGDEPGQDRPRTPLPRDGGHDHREVRHPPRDEAPLYEVGEGCLFEEAQGARRRARRLPGRGLDHEGDHRDGGGGQLRDRGCQSHPGERGAAAHSLPRRAAVS